MNRKKLLIILLAILLLAAIVAGLIFFKVIDVNQLLGKISSEEDKVLSEYQLAIPGNIITNVKNSRKFVRCEIVLILSDEKEAQRLEAETFKVKDVMLEILRGTEELEYRADEIQKNLSEKLISKMEEIHNIKSITKVYYKQLITQ